MPGRKKVSRKKRSAPSQGSRARKTTTKKKVTKKKVAKKKVVRKKATKAERKATRPTRRKPQTNGDQATVIKDLFPCVTQTSNFTDEQRWDVMMVFCRTYSTRGIIRDACLAAGISPRTYKRWRKDYEDFHEACELAEEFAADIVEAEARRRALEGFERPVIYKGEITDTYTDYSDSLMAMLLKGSKPERYKERSKVEHGGKIGRPMELEKEDKESIVSSILGMISSKPDPEGGAPNA